MLTGNTPPLKARCFARHARTFAIVCENFRAECERLRKICHLLDPHVYFAPPVATCHAPLVCALLSKGCQSGWESSVQKVNIWRPKRGEFVGYNGRNGGKYT
jgi:hypothetical protein